MLRHCFFHHLAIVFDESVFVVLVLIKITCPCSYFPTANRVERRVVDLNLLLVVRLCIAASLKVSQLRYGVDLVHPYQ